MASRIHGDVYVRFRGRYAETCRRKAVRRCIPSLQTNLQEARPELWQKLEKEYSLPNIENGEYFSFAPVDALITLTTLYREMKSLCRKRNSSNLERRSMEHYSMR